VAYGKIKSGSNEAEMFGEELIETGKKCVYFCPNPIWFVKRVKKIL